MKNLINFILIISLSITAYAQSLSGEYLYTGENATLTLTLQQSGNNLSGTLSSSTGSKFEIQGENNDGVGMGYCGNQDGTSFFEAYLEGNQLTFGLIEPDANNMPNYDQAQHILFTKQDNESGQQQSAVQQQSASNQTTFNSSQNFQVITGSSQIGSNEVGDEFWGFKLVPPAGWIHQKNNEGILLGHNSIAGMIWIFPHQSANMQAMQAEMQDGIQEEGSYLSLELNSIKSCGKQVLSTEYSGVMDGTQVKAKGFGVLSPYGGGVYILAIATPQMMSNDLLKAEEQVVENLSFFKPDVDIELIKLFAGRWTTMTKNTQTSFYLYEDGRFVENYESTYSGDANSLGGTWGTANSSSSNGSWKVTGDKMKGQFIITLQNGNVVYYNYYRNGNKLNELYINDILYGRYDDY